MRRVLSSCSLSLEAVKHGHTISAVGVEPCTGRLYFSGGGGPPLHMKFSRDAAIPRIPAPHLLKQGQLQLAGASFREKTSVLQNARGF